MMNLPFLPAVKKNWAKLQKSGKTSSGVYTIAPDGSGAFNVFVTKQQPVRLGGGGVLDSVSEETGRLGCFPP